MYYRNASDRTFRLEKPISGCVGYKVVNTDGLKLENKQAVVTLMAGEDRTYLLKRTQQQCKFIPGGKVLAPIIEDDE